MTRRPHLVLDNYLPYLINRVGSAVAETFTAEALARLPGVSVERDQGEGRFIRVRGLGADYQTPTVRKKIFHLRAEKFQRVSQQPECLGHGAQFLLALVLPWKRVLKSR